MHRRHRAIVIPTQRRSSGWVKYLAGTAVLCGVALAGALVGLRLLDPVGANPTQETSELLAHPLTLDAPAAGAATPPEQAERAEQGERAAPARPARQSAQPAAQGGAISCADCGVVESVLQRSRAAPATGVGAVAGGVVGGLVGNQFGKGDGRRAMTVVGAVGGGLLGHEIEKKQRSQTEYLVRVRMPDGSLRERVHPHSLAIGSAVRLSEQGLQPLEGAR